MKIEIDDKRIVGFEVRQSAIGYAVFEGSKRLLDWGATSRSPLAGAVLRSKKRFLSILRLHAPEVVVVRRPHNINDTSALIEYIKLESCRLSIPFILITPDEIKEAFAIFRVRSNADRAEVLTRIFPELLIRLPPRRRVWQSEAHSMIVFGAVTAGFAFWQRKRNEPYAEM